jgi:WD40 repeat protein
VEGGGGEGVGLRCTMTGSGGWVGDVSWAPASGHLVAAAAFDGAARLWDIRAPGAPLHELTRHEGKALAVAWAGTGGVVTGGEDGKVRGAVL